MGLHSLVDKAGEKIKSCNSHDKKQKHGQLRALDNHRSSPKTLVRGASKHSYQDNRVADFVPNTDVNG